MIIYFLLGVCIRTHGRKKNYNIQINYGLSPDTKTDDINAAINDELNYQISVMFLGYNTNHHKSIMLIHGNNI